MTEGIQVIHYDRLNNTPAVRLATLGWLDGNSRGLGENVVNLYSCLKAFVAFAPNGRDLLPAGVMTYDVIENTNEFFIYQSYVLEEFRGRGLYTAMWNSIVAKGIQDKVHRIKSATSMRNIAMRSIAQRQGRVEEAVTLTFELGQ